MNDIINVSIAKVAFTIYREAYSILDGYLNELKEFYSNDDSCSEILDDIEDRVAELLIERGAKERLVTVNDINAIIDTLGRPALSNDEERGNDKEKASEKKIKRQLYKDPKNRVISGVCAGLSAFLKIDVVLTRIIFFVVLVGATSFFVKTNYHGAPSIVLVSLYAIFIYGFLSLIIPSAKSLEQRCAMRGESLSIDNIKERGRDVESTLDGTNRDSVGFFSLLCRFLRKFIGVILIIFGVLGIIVGWFLLIGSSVFSDYTPLCMTDYIIFNVDFVWLKMLAVVCYFIPFIGMLYSGIMISTKATSPKWRPGLVLLSVWVISFISIITLGLVGAKPYYNSDCNYTSFSVDKSIDTLYVNYKAAPLDKNYIPYISATDYYLKAMYMIKEGGTELSFVIYPTLRIYRMDREEREIKYRHHFFSPISLFDNANNQMGCNDLMSINGNTINVSPAHYNREEKFNGEDASIYLYIPKDVVVILKEPIEHKFIDDQRYSTSSIAPWWFN